MKNLNIIGLKELRENIENYIFQIKKGKSFIVVKRSKPVFKLVPFESEEEWEMAADFTKINKSGIEARKIIAALQKLNAHS